MNFTPSRGSEQYKSLVFHSDAPLRPQEFCCSALESQKTVLCCSMLLSTQKPYSWSNTKKLSCSSSVSKIWLLHSNLQNLVAPLHASLWRVKKQSLRALLFHAPLRSKTPDLRLSIRKHLFSFWINTYEIYFQVFYNHILETSVDILIVGIPNPPLFRLDIFVKFD